MKARGVWAVMAATIAVTALAGAQSRDEALIREGVALRAQGRDADALARFREAWTLSPTPRARGQMGWAAQALGRWRESEAALTDALAATTDPWIVRNRDALERSLADVRARLGDLLVVCDTPGARLSVDNEPAGALPLTAPVRVPAGAVTVRVEAPGHLAVTREGVRVRVGALTREEITLTPEPASRTIVDPPATSSATPPAVTPATTVAAAPSPTPASPVTSPPTVVVVPVTPPASGTGGALAPVGYTLLGLGAAGAITAAVSFALRESAVDRYTAGVRDGACVGADLPASSETDARCFDDRSAIETWGAMRWVGVGVGVAGVAAGVTLLVLDARRPSGARSLACAPWVGAGASCAIRF